MCIIKTCVHGGIVCQAVSKSTMADVQGAKVDGGKAWCQCLFVGVIGYLFMEALP